MKKILNRRQKIFGLFFFAFISPYLLWSAFVQLVLLKFAKLLFRLDLKTQQIIDDYFYQPIFNFLSD